MLSLPNFFVYAIFVATKDDIDSATRNICSDSDATKGPSVTDNLGFLRMIFGV
jgi:hypothetical protein